MLGCLAGPPSPHGTTVTGGTPTGTSTSGTTGQPPIELPASCEPPPTQPALEPDGEVSAGATLGEKVTLNHVGGATEGPVFATGQGGLFVFDPYPVRLRSIYHPRPDQRFEALAVLDQVRVVVHHPDDGLVLVDVTDPDVPVAVWSTPHERVSALAEWEGRLLVTTWDGSLEVWEFPVGGEPSRVGMVSGLVSPRAVWGQSEEAWVADAILGPVPVDLQVPEAPVLGDPWSVGQGSLDVASLGRVVYLAAGADGVIVVDATGPEPVVSTTLPVTGSAVSVAVSLDGATLWATDTARVYAYDLADPATPRAITARITDQFPLSAFGNGDLAWVADWEALDAWRLQDRVGRPIADAPVAAGKIESDAAWITVRNLGSVPLTLAGATVDVEGASVWASAGTVGPGQTVDLEVQLPAGTTSATACVATDDPHLPALNYVLSTDSAGYPVGEASLPFSLPDTEGRQHDLAMQLPRPVFLAFFATW